MAARAAEFEAAQVPISARIVRQTGKFYTIEMHAADQQNRDLAPSRELQRRYREFAALDMELRPKHPALPTLPHKSVFFRRTFDQSFADDRKHGLEVYLSALVADPSV